MPVKDMFIESFLLDAFNRCNEIKLPFPSKVSATKRTLWFSYRYIEYSQPSLFHTINLGFDFESEEHRFKYGTQFKICMNKPSWVENFKNLKENNYEFIQYKSCDIGNIKRLWDMDKIKGFIRNVYDYQL